MRTLGMSASLKVSATLLAVDGVKMSNPKRHGPGYHKHTVQGYGCEGYGNPANRRPPEKAGTRGAQKRQSEDPWPAAYKAAKANICDCDLCICLRCDDDE